jgi:hypothetical protein
VQGADVVAGDRKVQRYAPSFGLYRIANLVKNIRHDIAHEQAAAAQSFIGQVSHCHLRGSQQEIRGMVGQHPIVLLRHPAVEGPKSCLKMGQRQMQLHSSQRCRQRRVRIPVNQHPVRSLPLEDFFQSGKHGACLPSVTARADLQVVVGGGNLQIPEEDI